MYRVGMGYDSHRFASGRKLILGGIEIPYEKGLIGHSDADALCHSMIDAILGGTGLGDIGQHFPDTNRKWKDASSIELLKSIVELVRSKGFEIAWIDATIICEEPKLGPFFDAIKSSFQNAGIPEGAVNLKAKTNEAMGFIGRGEGLAVLCACTIISPS